jgi:hypothetical protein
VTGSSSPINPTVAASGGATAAVVDSMRAGQPDRPKGPEDGLGRLPPAQAPSPARAGPKGTHSPGLAVSSRRKTCHVWLLPPS